MPHNAPPMRASPATLIRGLLKVIAVVVLAAVVGVGLGYGLSEVRGTADSGQAVAFTGPASGTTGAASSADTGTSSAGGSTGTSTSSTISSGSGGAGSGGSSADEVAVTVLSATLKSATTASGRARQRASIGVRVRVTNRTGERVTLGSARIAADGANQVADPAQAADAGALLRPIADGASATGTYLFETAGDLTGTLQDSGSATLRIGDVATQVQLDDTTP